jgi:hypothetical protein
MHISRQLMVLAVLVASLNPAICPAPAAAQQAPAAATPPLCTGDVHIVRVSEIKPGMMSKFLDAVAAQKAWYKNAGSPDEIYAMRLEVQNPDTKAYSFSETQALTNHIIPTGRGKGPAHDAGYDAFVALFKDSSTITSEYVTCVAKR